MRTMWQVDMWHMCWSEQGDRKVLCVRCGKWICGRCAGVNRVIAKFYVYDVVSGYVADVLE